MTTGGSSSSSVTEPDCHAELSPTTSNAFQPYHEDQLHKASTDLYAFSPPSSSASSSPSYRKPTMRPTCSDDDVDSAEDSDSTVSGPQPQPQCEQQQQQTMPDSSPQSAPISSIPVCSCRDTQDHMIFSTETIRAVEIYPNSEDLLRHSAALGLELANKVDSLQAEVVDLRATNGSLESRLHETSSRLHAERKHSMHTLLKTERELCYLRVQEEQWVAIHDGIRERTPIVTAHNNTSDFAPSNSFDNNNNRNSNETPGDVNLVDATQYQKQYSTAYLTPNRKGQGVRIHRGSQDFINSPLNIATRLAEEERQEELQIKHTELIQNHKLLEIAVLNLTGKLHDSRAQCKEQAKELQTLHDSLSIERETCASLQTVNAAIEEEVRELRSFVREGSVLGGRIDSDALLNAQQRTSTAEVENTHTLQDELERDDMRDKLTRTSFQLKCALAANTEMKRAVVQLQECNAMAHADLQSTKVRECISCAQQQQQQHENDVDTDTSECEVAVEGEQEGEEDDEETNIESVVSSSPLPSNTVSPNKTVQQLKEQVESDYDTDSDCEIESEEEEEGTDFVLVAPPSPRQFQVVPEEQQEKQQHERDYMSPPNTPQPEAGTRSVTPMTPLSLPPSLIIEARPSSQATRPLPSPLLMPSSINNMKQIDFSEPAKSIGTQTIVPLEANTTGPTATVYYACDSSFNTDQNLLPEQVQASGESKERRHTCAYGNTATNNTLVHLERIRMRMRQNLQSSRSPRNANRLSSASKSRSPQSLFAASDMDDLAECVSDVVSVLASLLANVVDQCTGHDKRRPETGVDTKHPKERPPCPVSGWVNSLSDGVEDINSKFGVLSVLIQRINAHILETKTTSVQGVKSVRQRKRIMLNCGRQASESLDVIRRLESWRECLNRQVETQSRQEMAQSWVKTDPEVASMFAADVVRAFSCHMQAA